MIKTPKFDERTKFGASSEGQLTTPELIRITPESVVSLRYQGKAVAVRVTKVLEAQSSFEGMIESFDNQELEHGDLKHGDLVRFPYDKIEHILKWSEKIETC